MADTEFHVQLQFGPMLIGVFLNLILFGVLMNQVYFYFKTYSKDSVWTKLFVSYLFLVETANTAIDMAMMYQPLISEYGTQHAVQNFPTLFLMEPILIILISTPIQIFFARRVLKTTQSYWIPGIIVLLALASAAGGIITGVKIAMIKLFARKPELHWSALLWFITSAVADILITATLVRSLSQRKTGFELTDSVVDKIIRLTVQTGMITALCAVGDIAFFLALPHTALNFLWDLTLSKLYTNCLMSTLNARASFLKHTQSTSSAMRWNAPDPSMRRESRYPNERVTVGDTNVMSAPQVYELNNTKTMEVDELDEQSSFHRDAELGITVTKVVHRIEDPISENHIPYVR